MRAGGGGGGTQTAVKKNTLRPVFKERFEFFSVLVSDTVSVEVFDHEKVGSGQSLGAVSIPVREVNENKTLIDTYSLTGVRHGKIDLECSFTPYRQ